MYKPAAVGIASLIRRLEGMSGSSNELQNREPQGDEPFSCGDGCGCFPRPPIASDNKFFNLAPFYCCTKQSSFFDDYHHPSAADIYYPTIPVKMHGGMRRGGSGPLLNAIRDRVAQVYGDPVASSGGTPAPSPTSPVTGDCGASIPHVQFDIDACIISTVPPGKDGSFPMAAMTELLKQPDQFKAATGVTTIDETYRPVAPGMSRATVASRLSEYVFTGTGVAGAAMDAFYAPRSFVSLSNTDGLGKDYPSAMRCGKTPDARFVTSNYGGYNAIRDDSNASFAVWPPYWKNAEIFAHESGTTLSLESNSPEVGGASLNSANGASVSGPFVNTANPNPTPDPACRARSAGTQSKTHPDWKVSSLPIKQIRDADAYATVTAPYVDVDVPHGFDPDSIGSDLSSQFSSVKMASLLYEDEQLVASTCGSSSDPSGGSDISSIHLADRTGVAARWATTDIDALYDGRIQQMPDVEDAGSVGYFGLLSVFPYEMPNPSDTHTDSDALNRDPGPGPLILIAQAPGPGGIVNKASFPVGWSAYTVRNADQAAFRRAPPTAPKVPFSPNVELAAKNAQQEATYPAREGCNEKIPYPTDGGKRCTLMKDINTNPASHHNQSLVALSDPKLTCNGSNAYDYTEMPPPIYPVCGCLTYDAYRGNGKDKPFGDSSCGHTVCPYKNEPRRYADNLPEMGAYPIYVYAPLRRRVDIGSGTVVPRPPVALSLSDNGSTQLATTRIGPRVFDAEHMRVQFDMVPSLIPRYDDVENSLALIPLPRDVSSATRPDVGGACANAQASSDIRTPMQVSPLLRSQYLGAYYSPEVVRDVTGRRSGQLTITPAARAGSEESPFAVQLAVALQQDTHSSSAHGARPLVSATEVGRRWCGVRAPGGTGVPSSAPRLVSGLLRGDGLCDCVMIRNGIGAVPRSAEQRRAMAMMTQRSSATEDRARCWMPSCTGMDSVFGAATRPPLRPECDSKESICEHTVAINGNEFDGGVNIRTYVDMRCGDQNTAPPTA